jgi:ABC-type methionine transport system ATPase subunit
MIRLAAVDMHTAQHLVANCLSGDLVSGRTIILVTHHISLCLPVASYLIEMSHGELLRKGSIKEFRDTGLLQYAKENEEDFVQQSPPAQMPENEADVLQNGIERQPKPRRDKGKLIEAEARAEGRVSWRTYLTYIRAAGLLSWILTILLMVLIRVINVGNQVRRL